MVERMRQDAAIRKLEIIGEAVKPLTDATKQRRPENSLEADRGHARSIDPQLLRR